MLPEEAVPASDGCMALTLVMAIQDSSEEGWDYLGFKWTCGEHFNPSVRWSG